VDLKAGNCGGVRAFSTAALDQPRLSGPAAVRVPKCSNNRKLIHAADRHAVFGGERTNPVRGRPCRCSVADLFKKFSGNVQSSGRPPGLLWGVAKITGSEA
jgi:hypothetical protein